MTGGAPRPFRARLLGLGASLAVAAVVAFDTVPWLRGPAPYPPEWQWAYRVGGPAGSLTTAVACALLLLGLLAATLAGPARRRVRLAAGLGVVAAVLLGWGFQVSLLARDPGSPLHTLLSRARSRSYTSHHAVAVSAEARDPLDFLRRHAELLPEQARSAKHSATHPPGPVLYFRAALALCEWSPGMSRALLAAAGPTGTTTGEADPVRASALLGALGLGLLGALSAWPVFLLARELGSAPLAAARVAILWALLPGPALMTPQFDQALALPVAGATLFLLRAAAAEGARPTLALGAGLLGGTALFTSYGAAAFLAVCGSAALVTAPSGGWRDALRRRGATAGIAALCASIVAFVLPALLGHEPLRALTTALRIHREVYTAPRRYDLWLVFNPLDLALFLGLPIALILLLRATTRGDVTDTTTAMRFRRALLVGVAVLVLSGVTRGEVGRLWIPLMPALLVAAVAGRDDTPEGSAALELAAPVAILTLTMAAYWIT